MCKNDHFCEGSWIFIVALHGNHSDNSFMFQRISHSTNDFKLRRVSYLRQSHGACTKTAKCRLSRFSKYGGHSLCSSGASPAAAMAYLTGSLCIRQAKTIRVFQKQMRIGVRWFFTFVSLEHSLRFRPVNLLFIFLVPIIH